MCSHKIRHSRKFIRCLFIRRCVPNVSLSWATVTHKQQDWCIFISKAEAGELQAALLNFALTSFQRSGLTTIFGKWPRGRNKLQKAVKFHNYLSLSSIINRINNMLAIFGFQHLMLNIKVQNLRQLISMSMVLAQKTGNLTLESHPCTQAGTHAHTHNLWVMCDATAGTPRICRDATQATECNPGWGLLKNAWSGWPFFCPADLSSGLIGTRNVQVHQCVSRVILMKYSWNK